MSVKQVDSYPSLRLSVLLSLKELDQVGKGNSGPIRFVEVNEDETSLAVS